MHFQEEEDVEEEDEEGVVEVQGSQLFLKIIFLRADIWLLDNLVGEFSIKSLKRIKHMSFI